MISAETRKTELLQNIETLLQSIDEDNLDCPHEIANRLDLIINHSKLFMHSILNEAN